MGLMKELPCSD